METKKVAVIGAGLMGNQLAVAAAAAGYIVVCYSRKSSTLDKAKGFFEGWLEKQVKKGRMEETNAAKIYDRLSFTTELEAAAVNADIVIEAVADILETKRSVLAAVDRIAPEHALYCSNSSYIVSSRFCGAVRHPERVANVHFFNPALVMKLAEVVKGPHCSGEAIDAIVEFVKSLGKTPVIVNKEIYGFIVNRIFSAITKEACYLYDQGVAGIEDIDTAVKLGLSHPMGPFELLDMTGIDLEYDVLTEHYKTTGSPADKPSTILVEKHALGQYGRKTGEGFYTY